MLEEWIGEPSAETETGNSSTYTLTTSSTDRNPSTVSKGNSSEKRLATFPY
jgi:hypothetical protein